MKKLVGIVVLGLLWCNVSYSQDCSHIDYKKSKDEFTKCIKIKEKEKNLSDEDSYEKLSSDVSFGTIDFECLNICKQSVKGTFTIAELNAFCRMQCPLK